MSDTNLLRSVVNSSLNEYSLKLVHSHNNTEASTANSPNLPRCKHREEFYKRTQKKITIVSSKKSINACLQPVITIHVLHPQEKWLLYNKTGCGDGGAGGNHKVTQKGRVVVLCWVK